MEVSDRTWLSKLGRALPTYLRTSVRLEPTRLAVTEPAAGYTVEIDVGPGRDGAMLYFRSRATGRVYRLVEDIAIAADRIREEVTGPARRSLIAAHEALVLHRPGTSGRCVPCSRVLPCPPMMDAVKIMTAYGHLNSPVAIASAERGAHVCGTAWVHPYRH